MIEPRKFSTIDMSETRSWIVMRLPRIIECMIMCSQTKNHASNSILLCEITGFKFLQLVVVLTSTSITAVKFKQWPIWEGEGDHNSPMVLNGLTWGWPDEHYAGRASRQKSMCHKSMLLVVTCEMFWRTSRKIGGGEVMNSQEGCGVASDKKSIILPSVFSLTSVSYTMNESKYGVKSWLFLKIHHAGGGDLFQLSNQQSSKTIRSIRKLFIIRLLYYSCTVVIL